MSRAQRREEQRTARRMRRAPEGSVRRPLRVLSDLPAPIGERSSWKDVPGRAAALVRALLMLASGKSRSADAVFFPSNPLRTYAAAFGGLGLIAGDVGTLAYFLFGGHRYFNPWFLFGMPAVAVATGLIVIFGLSFVVRVVWREEADRRKEHALVAAASVPLILSTPLWLLIWVRLFFPSLEHGFLLLALPGLALGLFHSMRHLSRHFPARIRMAALCGVAGAYLAGLYFTPAVAAWLLRLLRL